MELEEFIEQYLLRNPRPKEENQTRKMIYDIKLGDISEFFLQLKSQGYTDSLTTEAARLIVFSHERGFGTAWDYASAHGSNQGMKLAISGIKCPITH